MESVYSKIQLPHTTKHPFLKPNAAYAVNVNRRATNSANIVKQKDTRTVINHNLRLLQRLSVFMNPIVNK